MDGATLVVAVTGDVDVATAAALRAALDAAVASPAAQITVDLGGCELMCSVGIAELLRVDRQLPPESGRRLLILPGPPQVQRVFEITGLRGVLPFAS